MEMDEVDYTAAASYYSNQPFFTHRPGPVYTIPEDEEQDDGQVSSDSKYYGAFILKCIISIFYFVVQMLLLFKWRVFVPHWPCKYARAFA